MIRPALLTPFNRRSLYSLTERAILNRLDALEAIGQSRNLTQHSRKLPLKTVLLKPLVIRPGWGYIENLPMLIWREPPAISIMLFLLNQQNLPLSLMVKIFIIPQ